MSSVASSANASSNAPIVRLSMPCFRLRLINIEVTRAMPCQAFYTGRRTRISKRQDAMAKPKISESLYSQTTSNLIGDCMRTTLSFEGALELILQKAVDLGLARSKTDALRMGILSLNKEYGLVKDVEDELAARRLMEEENEMKRTKTKYLSEKAALSKYR